MKPFSFARVLLLPVLLAAGGAAAPAFAQLNVHVTIAPPALQYEPVPIIATGYVWAPGYWGWNGDRYAWIRGRQIAHRTGYRWEPDRWEDRDGRYFRHGGRWERDAGFKSAKVKKHDFHDHGRGHGDGHGKHHGKGKGGKHHG